MCSIVRPCLDLPHQINVYVLKGYSFSVFRRNYLMLNYFKFDHSKILSSKIEMRKSHLQLCCADKCLNFVALLVFQVTHLT